MCTLIITQLQLHLDLKAQIHPTFIINLLLINRNISRSHCILNTVLGIEMKDTVLGLQRSSQAISRVKQVKNSEENVITKYIQGPIEAQGGATYSLRHRRTQCIFGNGQLAQS